MLTNIINPRTGGDGLKFDLILTLRFCKRVSSSLIDFCPSLDCELGFQIIMLRRQPTPLTLNEDDIRAFSQLQTSKQQKPHEPLASTRKATQHEIRKRLGLESLQTPGSSARAADLLQ
eukprot:TRINITY_DN7278_c0_g1_i1.p1 TRINITY_DN7278_c0_g1~~TRINITY_DN7278_c0_g1_i1.p1  ORF type:complete len:118 (+),score=4.13 TRINITY_DN7278_c0_g1_i1:189-542(+)